MDKHAEDCLSYSETSWYKLRNMILSISRRLYCRNVHKVHEQRNFKLNKCIQIMLFSSCYFPEHFSHFLKELWSLLRYFHMAYISIFTFLLFHTFFMISCQNYFPFSLTITVTVVLFSFLNFLDQLLIGFSRYPPIFFLTNFSFICGNFLHIFSGLQTLPFSSDS